MSGDIRATGHKMKRFLLLPAAVMLGLTSASTVPAQAGGGDVAAGLIGGLAAGTIIGAAVTAPRYYEPYYRPRSHSASSRRLKALGFSAKRRWAMRDARCAKSVERSPQAGVSRERQRTSG